MSSIDMYDTVIALMEHGKLDLYNEYNTDFTLLICNKLIDAVKEQRDGLISSDDPCDALLEQYQDIVLAKGEELSTLVKLHGHGRHMKDTTRQIAKEMSAILGHNSRSIVKSCQAISTESVINEEMSV